MSPVAPPSWSLPKLHFPVFDGENPQFWKTRCEKYFDVYGVQPEFWVRVATHHFHGNAARWLQLHESKGAQRRHGMSYAQHYVGSLVESSISPTSVSFAL